MQEGHSEGGAASRSAVFLRPKEGVEQSYWSGDQAATSAGEELGPRGAGRGVAYKGKRPRRFLIKR